MMFDTFRREQTNALSGDWSSFDMGLESRAMLRRSCGDCSRPSPHPTCGRQFADGD